MCRSIISSYVDSTERFYRENYQNLVRLRQKKTRILGDVLKCSIILSDIYLTYIVKLIISEAHRRNWQCR